MIFIKVYFIISSIITAIYTIAYIEESVEYRDFDITELAIGMLIMFFFWWLGLIGLAVHWIEDLINNR